MPVLMLKRIDESPIGEWNDDDYSDSNREVEVRWGSAHWLTVSSCRDFAPVFKLLQLRSWLFGFMSGLNSVMTAQGELFEETEIDALPVRVDKYCSENPLNTLGQAANALGIDAMLMRGVASGRIKL